jgi:MerR family mercuric resistance operon transcriptional regulator
VGKAKVMLRIGELARRAGVSPDTIRHYERRGVLGEPDRASNGYREYPEETLHRILAVRGALGVGFTLDELAAIAKERARGGTPCRSVRDLAGRKLLGVEARLVELGEVRTELRRLVAEWDRRLSQTPAGRRAGLLDSLGAGSRPAGRRPPASRFTTKRRA